MEPKCPIHNPENRVRALIVFEVLRAVLMLAIIVWWGWLLTKYVSPRMVYGEASAILLLVSLSTFFSLWFYVRDVRRTRELKSFFAAMAHELRTPLTSIRLSAESLSTTSKSPVIGRLIADTSRLEAQVERGLELARVESGKPLHLSEIDLAENWRRALALFSAAEKRKLKITKGTFTKILAEEHSVQVILRNLIENALAHGNKKNVSIFIHAETKEDEIVVTFRDNGTGFKGDTKKLGQIFYKGAKSKGTGLGLYLIKSLMKAQGGTARFSGRDGFSAILKFRKP